VTLFDEIIKFNELCLNDPHKIECDFTNGQELDYVEVHLVAHLPPLHSQG